jgi:hypothetical protein
MSLFFEIAVSLLLVGGTVWAWWSLRPPKPPRERSDSSAAGPTLGGDGDSDG